jgi:alpha-amylase
MKTICLYFEIHQIIHLKRYRFFDIGRDHFYYDDYENERSITEIAERSYVPALQTLIEMAQENIKFFKVALSISGVGLEQLELHAPQVVDLLQELNNTGCLEFLCEPYSHGLSSLANEDSFREETIRMRNKIKETFGKTPKVFRNSSLIYSDEIGAQVAAMGFKGMLAEGAKHILGWKSPHFLYNCTMNPKLSLLLRDYKLSDDISLRFSNTEWDEYPLFAETYMDWIAQMPENEEVINIFMELSALGIFQPISSNILEFLKALPRCARERGINFATPSEIIAQHKSVGGIEVPYPTSWVDEERDTSCWLGNPMQREAFNKLYSVAERVRICTDRRIKQDWDYLQASNNFRFMTTKPASVGLNRGIYDNPYDAFTNYMNILGDFIHRVNALYPADIENEELNSLLTTIKNQGEELEQKDKQIEKLTAQLEELAPADEKKAEDKIPTPKAVRSRSTAAVSSAKSGHKSTAPTAP